MSQSRNRRRTRAQSHSPSFQLSGPDGHQSVRQSGQYVSAYPRTRRPPPPTQQRKPTPSNRRVPSPPFSRLPISQLPSSHTPQPQALLRSILEHFLARKPDLEALCFNSLRCAANFAIPLFNNNCISHSYHSGCLFLTSYLSSLSPVTAPTQSKARRKGTTNTRGGLLFCSDLLSSAQLSSVCDTAALLLLHPANAPSTPTSTRRGHPRPRGPLSCVLLPSCPACTTALRGDSRRTEASPHSLAVPVCSCRPLELWQRNKPLGE